MARTAAKARTNHALLVVTRSDWGARPFNGTVQSLGSVRDVVVHHAAGSSAQSLDDGKRRAREIQVFHQDVRRWADIGYHFLVDGVGNVYQGRPYWSGRSIVQVPRFAMGAHVKNQNAGKVGICLLGCFHRPEPNCNDIPSVDAVQTLEVLLRFLCSAYSVDPRRIATHRDFLDTSCPGDQLYPVVAELRRKISGS